MSVIAAVKIGDPVWIAGDPHRQGAERWHAVEIIGETRVSWIIGPAWMKERPERGDKYPKKSFPPHGVVLSEEGKKRYEYVAARYKIADRVRNVKDYDTLKAIEALVTAWEEKCR